LGNRRVMLKGETYLLLRGGAAAPINVVTLPKTRRGRGGRTTVDLRHPRPAEPRTPCGWPVQNLRLNPGWLAIARTSGAKFLSRLRRAKSRSPAGLTGNKPGLGAPATTLVTVWQMIAPRRGARRIGTAPPRRRGYFLFHDYSLANNLRSLLILPSPTRTNS
jgi:hypothetical protein